MGAAGVADGHIFAERRVKDVGEKPGEGAFGGQVLELQDAKVEIVVLFFPQLSANTLQSKHGAW